jgi:hypothetical protein
MRQLERTLNEEGAAHTPVDVLLNIRGVASREWGKRMANELCLVAHLAVKRARILHYPETGITLLQMSVDCLAANLRQFVLQIAGQFLR